MTKVTLDNTLGAAFLGTSASCILFGITVVQTHFYYNNYPNDWQFQKISVAVLMILATLHLAFTLHSTYHYLISSFGRPIVSLLSVVWSFKLQVVINVLMVTYVQGLYALRVWKLGKHFSRLWPTLLGMVVVGGYVLAFLVIVKTYETTTFTNLDKIRPVLLAAFSSATGIDVAIATAICYYLSRSRSSFVGINNKIVIIMRYVLISGFLTSACSLSVVILYATMPHNLVFISFSFLLPNIYVIGYISMLNARMSMNRQEVGPSVDVSKVIVGSFQRDDSNLNSVDDVNSIPLSSQRFISSFSNNSHREQAIPSTQFGILVHKTEDRQYD